jgi:succinate dehydrogenase hydrophobic anchor subunit
MRTTRLRLLLMLTGVLIAVLLGTHMVVIHLDSILGFFGAETTEPTSWESVMGRSGQGVWVALYIVLLAAALYHALYGLRGIIVEVTTSARLKRVISWAFIAIGVVAFAWGAYVPLALLSS